MNNNKIHIKDINNNSFINSFDSYKKNLEESNNTDILYIDNLLNLSSEAKIKVHDTITIGAETGYGKTALAVNIANSCLNAYNVVYVNVDSNNIDIQQRLISQATKCNIDDITIDKAYDYYNTFLLNKKKLMFLNDTNLDNIIKFIKAINEQSNVTIVVIIDTINNIDTSKNSSYENLKEVSKKLRDLTRNSNIIMFNLAQLNRASKKSEKSIIDCDMHSFTDASDIENDSTQVLLFGEKNGKDYITVKKNRYNSSCINNNIEVNYKRENQVIIEVQESTAAAETPKKAPKPQKKKK